VKPKACSAPGRDVDVRPRCGLGAAARRWAIVGVALHAAATLEAQRPTDQLSWLSGCWERRTANGVVEEQWSSNAGGMLHGFSRTVRRDTIVEYEFMRIFSTGDTLVFEAQPSRQAKAEFRAVPPFTPEVVFANPAHDFPQRVVYRRSGDSLLARVEGTRDGRLRVIPFPYVRVPCPK
jgi:hypothetical protein